MTRWLDPARLSDRDVDLVCALLNAARETDAPHLPPVGRAEVRTQVEHGWDGEPVPTGVVGTGIAVVTAALPADDDVAILHVVVDPSQRGRGLGGALMGDLLELARDRRRRTAVAESYSWSPAGEPLLRRHGFVAGHEQVARRHHLAPTDPPAVPSSYVVEVVAGTVPDDLAGALVPVLDAINDAPRDDIEMADVAHSVERLRRWEDGQRRRGQRVHRAVAREAATGRPVGQSVVTVDAAYPSAVTQHDLGVVAEHRGHGLGLVLKQAVVAHLAEHEPQARYVDTWNAASNDAVGAVNRRLGYRETGRAVGWQREL